MVLFFIPVATERRFKCIVDVIPMPSRILSPFINRRIDGIPRSLSCRRRRRRQHQRSITQ